MKSLILAVALVATPGLSQAAGCQAAFGALIDMLVAGDVIDEAPTALVRERPNGWCGVRALRVKVDRRTNLAIEEFAWRGEDMERFVTGGLPPTALEISAKGVRTPRHLGDADLDEEIAMAMLAEGSFDIDLSAAWERGARQLVLEDVRLRKTSGDELRLNATIDNIDLTSQATIQMSAGGLALSSASLDVKTEEAFVPFFKGLGDSGDSALDEFLARFPAETLNESSREALRKLSEHGPIGDLSIGFAAEGGFSALRFAPFYISGTIPDRAAIWDGVVLDVSFLPR